MFSSLLICNDLIIPKEVESTDETRCSLELEMYHNDFCFLVFCLHVWPPWCLQYYWLIFGLTQYWSRYPNCSQLCYVSPRTIEAINYCDSKEWDIHYNFLHSTFKAPNWFPTNLAQLDLGKSAFVHNNSLKLWIGTIRCSHTLWNSSYGGTNHRCTFCASTTIKSYHWRYVKDVQCMSAQ
jgi:hypothetical protein